MGCFLGLHFLFVVILKGVGNCRKAAGLFVNYVEQLCGVWWSWLPLLLFQSILGLHIIHCLLQKTVHYQPLSQSLMPLASVCHCFILLRNKITCCWLYVFHYIIWRVSRIHSILCLRSKRGMFHLAYARMYYPLSLWNYF